MMLVSVILSFFLLQGSVAQQHGGNRGNYNRGFYTSTFRPGSQDGSRGSYGGTRVSPEYESESSGEGFDSDEASGPGGEMSENSCSLGESYTIIDSSSSCCNHNITLIHGLDYHKFWNECAKPLRQNGSRANDLMEDYVNSTRRVYACILSRSIGERMVSLMSFADMMSSRYPAEIRTEIMRTVKNTNTSLKEIRMGDYERVREIRNKFFDIQRNICTAMDPKRRRTMSHTKHERRVEAMDPDRDTQQEGPCDEYEEAERNGGSCCKGQSVPLDLDYWRPPSSNTRFCNVTLLEQFRRWRIRANDIDAAMEICGDVCQLLPEGPKATRFLENIKFNDYRDVAAQIRSVIPSYLSQYMLGVVQNYSRQHYTNVINENELMRTYGIDLETAKAVKPCVNFRKLSDTVFDALHDYCFPPEKSNVRIQSQGRRPF